MAGVYRQTIKSLRPETQNSLIVGVIINSTSAKSFDVKNPRFGSGERSVWSFTLRDSETDFINVTVWGSIGYIRDLSSNFHIGHVVDVINGKVAARRSDDRNESFVPSVSSPCTLTLNEGVSDLQRHDAPDRSKYEMLLRLPTKNLIHLKTLDTVLENIEDKCGQYVDLLVVLMFMGEARDLITRDGRAVVYRDIEVADGSVEAAMPLRLWEAEWVERAGYWQPRHTILCLADAQITFNTFKKKTAVNIGRKTLITEDPNISQVSNLRTAARRIPERSIPTNSFATSDSNGITTVMTIREILEKLNAEQLNNGERIQFTATVYAIVNQMNLDGTESILTTKCALCKRTVPDNHDSCMNLECSCGNGTRAPINVVIFNLKLNISDHTGHLIGCRLTGATAERVLRCSVKQFKSMSLEKRGELKWRYVLEKCEIRIQVLGRTSTWPCPLYNVLSIERIQQDEAVPEDTNMSTTSYY